MLLGKEHIEIEEIDAKELIVPERIDLIAKLKYIEYQENGQSLDFVEALYKAHIEAFSNGSYIEPGNNSKNSITKYFNTFNNLIDNIKQNGLDKNISVVPVGKNNVIINGAHRVAIAAYFNLKVPIRRYENLSVNFGVDFFQNQLLHEKYIDFLVCEYCKVKDNLIMVCSWSEPKESMELIDFNEYKVFFKKRITFKSDDWQNLITKIDSNIGLINISGKSKKYLTIYLLECKSFDEVLDLRKNIKENFNFIYITNNQNEIIKLADVLLNEYSGDFLFSKKKNHFIELKNGAKRKVRNLKHSINMKLLLLAEKIGLYDEIRIIYHKLKDIVK